MLRDDCMTEWTFTKSVTLILWYISTVKDILVFCIFVILWEIYKLKLQIVNNTLNHLASYILMNSIVMSLTNNSLRALGKFNDSSDSYNQTMSI